MTATHKIHAIQEFQAAGWMDEKRKCANILQEQLCKDVLELLELFEEQGHSSSSSTATISVFETLARFIPLTPLTGQDEEWRDLDKTTFQNKRCPHVYKQANKFDGQAYWRNGRMFWEWDKSGKEKVFYLTAESDVPIEFPFSVPSSPEYVFAPRSQTLE